MKRILFAMLLGVLVTAWSEELKEVTVLKSVYLASEFRNMALKDPASAVKGLFSQRAALRWSRIANEYSVEQLTDFFMGTTVLGSENFSYPALYNPWWDTVLLMNVSGLQNDAPQIDGFCFVSGMLFRAESEDKTNLYEGTVPAAKPFAVDLWNVSMRTSKRYEGYFVKNAAAEFARLQMTNAEDTKRIQIRSALRLKLLQLFLRNKPMQKEARRICTYLTAGKEERMLKYFKDGGADFVKKFAEVPKIFRANFVPYCYFPGEEGTLFVFFNSEMPRIFVTVTYPRKSFDRIMEWYDLEASEELMAVWNSKPEVK